MPLRATAVANLPLGVIAPTDYVQFAVKLSKGDLVLIYSDSLIESKNSEGISLSEKGLLERGSVARLLARRDPAS